MSIIVTGGTGFIGKHLIDRLVLRGVHVHVLVRARSVPALEALVAARWPSHAAHIHALVGDITEPGCGIAPASVESLKGEVSALFHLAAVYDMGVDDTTAELANVDGTRHALELAHAVGCSFHHTSSIAVTGGVVRGTFTEQQFDEGQELTHPYYRTKFVSEKLVRDEARVPYRIYRPGVVVGSSATGEADKVDGPYYAFQFLKLAKKRLPHWLPLLGPAGGVLNIVPVDYVASAMDAIAHTPGLDGQTFHLVGPNAPTMLEAMAEFSKAAGGPSRAVALPKSLLPRRSARDKGRTRRPRAHPMVRAFRQGFVDKTGIPESVLSASEWHTRFDCTNAERVLAPLGIRCPELPSYAAKLWAYWDEHLSHKRARLAAEARGVLSRGVRGKRVLITGASSGIGEAVAHKVAREGGLVVLVARTEDKLVHVRDAIVAEGGRAEYHVCDMSEPASIDALLATLATEAPIDVLVNNAGRSIRRSLAHSYDRLHDFERTMQLNYFGALRLTMGLLPGMRARRNGHVINISSAGVQVYTPRFAAYIASKAAFDAFSQVAAGEVLGDNVHFTTVYMPLVRTPMIAPTKGYEYAPALSPEEAADWVVSAIDGRPERLTRNMGAAFQMLSDLNPDLMTKLRNFGYRYTPGSTKARPKPAH